ncbi:hypothetical protein [Paenibacillus sp. JNUCC31]|nr:hypothetical protein [Paenibacillus sp. JNUCC-31]
MSAQKFTLESPYLSEDQYTKLVEIPPLTEITQPITGHVLSHWACVGKSD